MAIDPDLCLDVPEGFDDTDAESQVYPVARKMFLSATAAEAFRKAYEWVGEHKVRLIDVSWDMLDDEDEPYALSIYFGFELDPEEP
jgi:hypothetical protein